MNRSIRDELLQVLSRFGDHAPEYRFGQLIANLAFLARLTGPSDVWDVEDEEMLEIARSHLQDFERRSEAMATRSST